MHRVSVRIAITAIMFGLGGTARAEAETGGITVYVKVDFDSGSHPFAVQGAGAVDVDNRPGYVIAGRSLHVKRAKPKGYFGGRMPLEIEGSTGLKIAFCVRSKGMHKLAVNFFDSVANDNTTPASPARLRDDAWTPVVFSVADFFYNSGQPEDKVRTNTKHASLFFHGRETKGATGEYWIDKVIIYRGSDTQPPAAPTDLSTKAVPRGRVELTWNEPADNAFAVVYGVHRKRADGAWKKVGESMLPRHVDTVPATGRYTYRVTAADYDNNVSLPSADVVVSVGEAGTPPKVTDQRVTDRLAYAENVRTVRAAGKGKVRPDVFMFFGDSITAANVYTYHLGSALGRGITVRRGYGGMRTDFARKRIDEFLDTHKPEFAIVMFGTNDSKTERTVPQSMQNMTYVIDACIKRGTVPVIATIPPRGFDKEKQDRQVRYNQALIRLCRQKRVPVSYVYEEMIQRDLRKMLNDGVHLHSVAGNETAGASLRKTFDQIWFALRDGRAMWK